MGVIDVRSGAKLSKLGRGSCPSSEDSELESEITRGLDHGGGGTSSQFRGQRLFDIASCRGNGLGCSAAHFQPENWLIRCLTCDSTLIHATTLSGESSSCRSSLQSSTLLTTLHMIPFQP